ncbi:hypothetical protein J2D69_12940 [Lysinibacillus sphaericus]|uniref:Uncharacterized protein n=3 Tax=Lysinibacillus TaxID=400634 RepID=B1HPZ7_LYSSC|nr:MULTISPECIES: hypothetical protein [Lysinibacillus]MBE5083606.1 hypothetical protein [Bacillus thuringiensis]ACA40640.1 hypothetical protein Bsph_3127 [Lysinibacillus sphaericus C3-41]AMO33376.1 hypothetical protein AR327_13470 [Lysinibacillus sphaericus]AMR91521.1 hypothetical protein A1T07_15750 [Lysinibacillus sphaericus]ANA45568.1 hypothetical protein A2J09_08410 [Lysinibacillus sphaericus]
MKIQTNNTLIYFKTEVNKNIKNESLLDLFGIKNKDEDENEKNIKPKFETRYEDGYIRTYLVKSNGQKLVRVLVKEVKQTKENMKESIDIEDMLIQELEKVSNPQKYEQNTSIFEKEKNISKYKTGI